MTSLREYVTAMVANGCTLGEIEREARLLAVLGALKLSRGNCCKAASALKVHRNTMTRVLAEQGLSVREMGNAARRAVAR